MSTTTSNDPARSNSGIARPADAERVRLVRRLAAARLVVATLGSAASAATGVLGRAWAPGVVLFAGYWAAAAAIAFASRRDDRAARAAPFAIALLDVPVFLVARGWPDAPFAAAATSLGLSIDVLLVCASALALDRRVAACAGGIAASGEIVLGLDQGSSFGAIAARVAVVALATAVSVVASRRPEPVAAPIALPAPADPGPASAASPADAARSDKLAAVGQLASTVAEELGAPLAKLRSELYWTKRRLSESPIGDEERTKEAFGAMDAALAASAMAVAKLTAFARERPLAPTETLLAGLVDDAAARVRLPHLVRVANEVPREVVAVVDAELLRQALAHLIQNAAEAYALERAALVRVRLEEEPGFVGLQVSDDANGIAEDQLDRIFDPLYSTRAGATGLGLSIVRAIARRHGGSILVRSRRGEGTSVMLRLPV